MKKLISITLILAALLGGCGAEPAQTVSTDAGLLENIYTVNRVVDGDTIIIDLGGTKERVRLIGVDTPESVHPDADKNVSYGEIASEFTKQKLEGKTVTLEYDVQERDQYGRILAYIYLDGKMFNKTLLEEGHAKIATYPPNVKYVEEFTVLQEQARENKKGVWEYEAFKKDVSDAAPMNSNLGSNSHASSSQASTPQADDVKKTEAAYIGNSNTMKFHKINCRYVKQMADHNKVDLKTRDDAIAGGYDSCKACKP